MYAKISDASKKTDRALETFPSHTARCAPIYVPHHQSFPDTSEMTSKINSQDRRTQCAPPSPHTPHAHTQAGAPAPLQFLLLSLNETLPRFSL